MVRLPQILPSPWPNELLADGVIDPVSCLPLIPMGLNPLFWNQNRNGRDHT